MRGFTAAVFLFAGAINGAMLWRPAEAAPVKVASWLKTDKVQDRLPVHPVKTVSYRLPWTCAEIRAYARTHTEAEMHAKAVEHKLSPQQRAIAKACLEKR